MTITINSNRIRLVQYAVSAICGRGIGYDARGTTYTVHSHSHSWKEIAL